MLAEGAERRNSARWAIALALGLRQSEALGLKWDDVDLANGTLTVRRGRQRPRWRHGCAGTCGRKHGGHCPSRVPVRAETAETKSRAGRRSIGLPDELVALLRQHEKEQDAERETAGQLWREGRWLFATPTGEPVNPRADYDEWKRLLRLAGYGTAGCTTPATPRRRCSYCWACRIGRSSASWAGPSRRWRSGTNT